MSAKVHVGLVGCGRWGANCLRDLIALGCEVTVVSNSADSTERAITGGASRIVKEMNQLPEIDGAVIATPTATHAEVIEQLLGRQIPLFVEKPLAPDLRVAEELVRKAPQHIFVMDKWRYHPGIEMLRDIAQSQELGKVIGLRSTRMQWNSNHSDVDGVWILAPHDLSIGIEILGYLPDPVSAIGEVNAGELQGLIGYLGKEPWFCLELSTRYHRFFREVRLICAEGIAVLDGGYADCVQIVRAASYEPHLTTEVEPERRMISTELPLLRELRAFSEYLCGGPPPRSSSADALRQTVVLNQLRQLAFGTAEIAI